MMARHLVTGAAGFLWSHIIEKLHTMDETGIIACDILKCDQATTRVQYVEGYVLDSDLLLDLTRQVDYIHHIAALVQ
jgi:nucleoside-diphosphate-sugar epimerase